MKFAGALLAGVVVGVLVGAAAVWHFAPAVAGAPAYDSTTYQAVFLSNNQVYFGKLTGMDTQYPTLTDVYYIQALQSQDLASTTATGLKLVKLGSELHGPQDMLQINRDQILFVETLKPDSEVVKSIEGFQSQQ